jgi:hypothetical protein
VFLRGARSLSASVFDATIYVVGDAIDSANDEFMKALSTFSLRRLTLHGKQP